MWYWRINIHHLLYSKTKLQSCTLILLFISAISPRTLHPSHSNPDTLLFMPAYLRLVAFAEIEHEPWYNSSNNKKNNEGNENNNNHNNIRSKMVENWVCRSTMVGLFLGQSRAHSTTLCPAISLPSPYHFPWFSPGALWRSWHSWTQRMHQEQCSSSTPSK